MSSEDIALSLQEMFDIYQKTLSLNAKAEGGQRVRGDFFCQI